MKNKFNKKGFTLIELLAVLVVLVTILLIAIPSITSTLERNKEKDKLQKMKIIKSAGETYFSIYKKNDDCSSGCDIDIAMLKGKNLLSDSEAKDTDGNDIDVIVRCNNSGNCAVGKKCCDESGTTCEFKEGESSCS